MRESPSVEASLSIALLYLPGGKIMESKVALKTDHQIYDATYVEKQ
jgi:hypothetical protein